MGEQGLDAGIDFGVLHDELRFAVFLRHGIIRLDDDRAERLFARDQVIGAVEDGQGEGENQSGPLDESHNGLDILTKWQGSLVTTSLGKGAWPVGA